MMQVFNGTVRLQGSVMNEVERRGLTVPEIIVLRRIHGDDGVVKLQHVGDAEIDHIEERERLHIEYAQGLAALGDDQKTSIDKMFGQEYNPLPEKLRNFQGPLVDKVVYLEEARQPELIPGVNAPESEEQLTLKAKKGNSGKSTLKLPPNSKAKSIEAIA